MGVQAVDLKDNPAKHHTGIGEACLYLWFLLWIPSGKYCD